MLTALFSVIIYPVRLLIECIYAILSLSIFKENIGISLAGLSLAINLLCLPLYATAERMQQAERALQKKMAKRIASIKRCFKGDERIMITAMYYRENHYHPLMALRSSLSLLLQVPFFIAAYSFLSHLDSLAGRSLWLLRDLGAPDALFSVHGFAINVLPILMTAINLAAGMVYSKGLPAREQIQLYAMSLIFLVLLYNSPAALVLYWTMNNIFSLIKNILFKVKHPFRIVYIIGCALCLSFMIYIVFIRYNHPVRALRNKTFAITVLLLFASLPLFLRAARHAARTWLRFMFTTPSPNATTVFLLSCLSVWVLVGCFVPANLIAADPVQFASVPNVSSPYALLIDPALQAAGVFLFWAAYLFFLASSKAKAALATLSAGLALCVFANFFIFHGDYGILSGELSFDLPSNIFLASTPLIQAANLAVCALLIAVVCFIVSRKRIAWLPVCFVVLTLGSASLWASKLVHIKNVMAHEVELQTRMGEVEKAVQGDAPLSPVFPLSRNGKNVFIIMLDEAIGSYFPLILKERPELVDSFDGFTYYPNTASLYGRTLFGAPPLFGGYEYTAYRMNERNTELMKDKNNEALLMLPELFKGRGFDVTVTNIPYVNYEGGMDPHFYTRRGIKAQNIQGRYNATFTREVLGLEHYSAGLRLDELLKRNILMFAFLETSVYSVRDVISQNGKYWSTTDYSLNTGVPSIPFSSYATLYYLPQLTEITEAGGTLSIMVNDLTHDQTYLQYPDYTIAEKITNRGANFFSNDSSFKHYHVNSAAYLLLARWFSFLRDEGVWDNTRIIIVSDHGDGGIASPDFSSFQNNYVIRYNPILLVKDFNASSALRTDDTFMTNADVPLLAAAALIESPMNPFTGRPLSADKAEGVYIFAGGYTNAAYYSGTTCLEDDSPFYYVRDSIFDSKNWKELRYRDFKR
jgi:YidC/Oxa1 family membrane protein insertase